MLTTFHFKEMWILCKWCDLLQLQSHKLWSNNNNDLWKAESCWCWLLENFICPQALPWGKPLGDLQSLTITSFSSYLLGQSHVSLLHLSIWTSDWQATDLYFLWDSEFILLWGVNFELLLWTSVLQILKHTNSLHARVVPWKWKGTTWMNEANHMH